MLHLFCGKMASGKSTLAKRIASEQPCVLLAEDQLLSSLYPGEVTDVASYARLSERIRTAVRMPVIEALRSGVVVVLDFPANTQAQRRGLTTLAADAGTTHTLHYLPRSDRQCKTQLARRAAECPERRATDTVEMFDAMAVHFEPPHDGEGLEVVVHDAEAS